MVNYCCILGCGRNSRRSKQLNYYSLPKERERQIQWLKAGGREDLLDRSQDRLTHRICSRHFPPSSIKNKHLCSDAIPTLFLPGSSNEDESDPELVEHHGIICNNCKEVILGFRYKCVSCLDYDLCPKCESLETHAEHYMLRIPKPMKFKSADNLVCKWKQFFNSEHITVQNADTEADIKSHASDSSDDEPITKYVRNYDSGIDLSEDLKEKIRNEVSRVLSLKEDDKKPKKKVKNKRKVGDDATKSAKKTKTIDIFEDVKDDVNESAPEMVFVNEEMLPVKNESNMAHDNSTLVPVQQQLVHVKLSDDLTELMIEIPGINENTVYKYQ